MDQLLNDRSSVNELHRQPVYRIAAGKSFQRKLRGMGIVAIEEGAIPDECFQVDGNRLDVLLLGRYMRRGGTANDPGPDRLQLEITLLDTKQKVNIARIQTSIVINQELWAMLGGSRDQRTPPKITSTASQGNAAPAPTYVQTSSSRHDTIAQWNQAAEEIHPQLVKTNATFGVSIYQNLPGQSPTLTPWLQHFNDDPNQLAFETSEGNELSIHLENRTDEALAFIVQIDGVNQLGRQVSLPSQSAYWHMPPRGKAIIDQWLDFPDDRQIQEKSRYIPGTKLLVVSPPRSVAGQQEITEGLGEIRVLVYGPRKNLAIADLQGTRPARSASAKEVKRGTSFR